jgi:hypothetical protein
MWTVVVVVVVVVLAEKNQHVTRQHFQHGQFHYPPPILEQPSTKSCRFFMYTGF